MGFIEVICVGVILLYDGGLSEVSDKQKACELMTIDPVFEPQMVIGGDWHIYYSWNMNLSSKCLSLEFNLATPAAVNRIYNDMTEYLETQPCWFAATLTLIMGSANHEMLLFADQGPAGKFTGVPNVILDSNIPPAKHSVPLLQFQFKVLHNGKYLLMSDCDIGLTTLATRVPVGKKDIIEAVSNLNFGEGFHACE